MSISVLKWLLVFVWAAPRAAPQTATEKRAIQIVQRLSAARLQPGLPKQAFADWLSGAVGAGAKIRWEVNDCGEQSGNPDVDRGRDFPMCVGAAATLPRGQTVVVEVVVGTFGKGITGTRQVVSIGILDGGKDEFVARLSDLAPKIKALR
jgi:hypothetical protein